MDRIVLSSNNKDGAGISSAFNLITQGSISDETGHRVTPGVKHDLIVIQIRVRMFLEEN